METDLRAHSAGPMAQHPEIWRLPVTYPGRRRIAAAGFNSPFASADIAGPSRCFTDTFGGILLLRIKYRPTRLIGHFADLAESLGEPAGRFLMRGKTIVPA